MRQAESSGAAPRTHQEFDICLLKISGPILMIKDALTDLLYPPEFGYNKDNVLLSWLQRCRAASCQCRREHAL